MAVVQFKQRVLILACSTQVVQLQSSKKRCQQTQIEAAMLIGHLVSNIFDVGLYLRDVRIFTLIV